MIDILLSTYNGGQYLREQLDSLLAQTCQEWELYIRDDGSSDITLSLIEEYCKEYPEKIHFYQDELGNIGSMHSFEELLTHCAHSEYVMFCDQDDVWLPEKIDVFYQAMKCLEAECGSDVPLLVHGDMHVVNQSLQLIHDSFWKYANLRPDLLDENAHFLGICNDITGCSCLFNQKARQVSLPFNPRSYMHDAWLGVSVVAHGGKIHPVYKPTMLYRQHGNNTLGAVEYSRSLLNLGFRWKLACQSYANSHPLIFKNVLSFVWYKLHYLFTRHFTK